MGKASRSLSRFFTSKGSRVVSMPIFSLSVFRASDEEPGFRGGFWRFGGVFRSGGSRGRITVSSCTRGVHCQGSRLSPSRRTNTFKNTADPTLLLRSLTEPELRKTGGDKLHFLTKQISRIGSLSCNKHKWTHGILLDQFPRRQLGLCLTR